MIEDGCTHAASSAGSLAKALVAGSKWMLSVTFNNKSKIIIIIFIILFISIVIIIIVTFILNKYLKLIAYDDENMMIVRWLLRSLTWRQSIF